jgi:hypothetical protein
VRERFWLSHPRNKGIQLEAHSEGVQEGYWFPRICLSMAAEVSTLEIISP